MNTQNEHIDLLIFKHLDKSASAQESAELLQWVTSHEQNKRYFQEVSKQFIAMSGTAIDFDAEKAWNTRKQNNTNKKSWLKRNPIIFSVTMGLIGIGIAWWLLRTETDAKEVDKPLVVEQYLSSDTLKDIVLSNNLKITLDTNTQLSLVPTGQLRVIGIRGRAFLQIPKGANNYAIKTPSGLCRLKEGQFQIAQTNDKSPVDIRIIDGAATLISDSTNAPVELQKNNAVTVQKGKAIQQTGIRNTNYLAWKTGVLEFDNTPLREAIVSIAEYYQKDITIETQGLENCLLNAKLDRYSFDEVKTMFEIAFNAKFREEGKIIFISGTPCN